MKILLMEDDTAYRDSMVEVLETEGYKVDAYGDGEKAMDAVFSHSYDLLLLDIRVPGMDGYELLKLVREYHLKVPVIFITSLTDIQNLSIGYELGCNDYLRKPFAMKELKYRVAQAIKSHHFQESSTVVELPCGAVLDLEKETLKREGESIALSKKESELLCFLARHPERFFSIDDLRETIWKGKEIKDGDVRMHVKKIREKSCMEMIENRRGIGYGIGKRA